MSILRNKFCNSKYQLKLQKNKNVFATIKLAILIAQLNSTIIANIRIIDLNKKVFEKLYSILDFILFRPLI